MKRKAWIIGLALLLTACGTAEKPAGDAEEEPAANAAENRQEDVRTVSGRDIIASLEQTATDTSARDKQAASVREDPAFKEGYMGEPTDELAEDLAVQGIEGIIATEALIQVYGSYENLNKAGIIFYENQTSGHDQSGFWFGVKEPDERLDEWLALLQEKVDTGEILAEPIYVFKSGYSQKDLELRMLEASKILRPMQQAHHNPEAASYNVSADTLTGAIEVEHNFLTDAQTDKLRSALPEYELKIGTLGHMVPGPDEPDAVYPDPETVQTPSSEGYYVMDVSDDQFLAVAAKASDFSSTGGEEEHYSAIYFGFADAAEKLEIGQRVLVETTGSIMESYPAQGQAVFVEVLPAYKPDGADLSEPQVVQKTAERMQGQSDSFVIIRSMEYSESEDRWNVSVLTSPFSGETFETEIEDQ